MAPNGRRRCTVASFSHRELEKKAAGLDLQCTPSEEIALSCSEGSAARLPVDEWSPGWVLCAHAVLSSSSFCGYNPRGLASLQVQLSPLHGRGSRGNNMTTHGKRRASPAPASKRRKTGDTAGAAAATRFFAEHDITVTGSSAPAEACVTIEDAPFAPALVAALHAQGFTAPSPVQGVTWPLAVRGLDVLAIAGTGQGKTLAYLLPALSRCALSSDTGARHRSAGPSCLVVVPTRELALQVQAEAHKFGGALGLRAVALHGGVPKDEQAQMLQQGADLVVATPGRLLDHLGRHRAHQANDGLPRASLRRCTSLVLDEADRLL